MTPGGTSDEPESDPKPTVEDTSEAAPEDETSEDDAAIEDAEPTEAEQTTPEPDLIDTHAIGETVHLPSADFTVRTIEERESITSSFPSSTPNFEAGDDERLWYLDIEWTNNSKEAVEKECHGPYSFDLKVYDVQGVEMLEVDQPGMIEGQNCSSGLRQGQAGTWLSAFYGGEAEFGWAVFIDYEGGDAFVALDPDLELVRDE